MVTAESLLEVLLNKAASISQRDDAAMDLSDHDEALHALVLLASDATEHPTILSSCGTSIAEIWKRQGVFDLEILKTLAEPTQAEIKASFA